MSLLYPANECLALAGSTEESILVFARLVLCAAAIANLPASLILPLILRGGGSEQHSPYRLATVGSIHAPRPIEQTSGLPAAHGISAPSDFPVPNI